MSASIAGTYSGSSADYRGVDEPIDWNSEPDRAVCSLFRLEQTAWAFTDPAAPVRLNAKPERFFQLAAHPNMQVRERVASSPHLPPLVAWLLVNRQVSRELASNPVCPPAVIVRLVTTKPLSMMQAASNPSCPVHILRSLHTLRPNRDTRPWFNSRHDKNDRSTGGWVRRQAMANMALPAEVVYDPRWLDEPYDWWTLIGRSDCPVDKMMEQVSDSSHAWFITGTIARNPAAPGRVITKLMSGYITDRKADEMILIAQHHNCPKRVLTKLTADPRRTVVDAANAALAARNRKGAAATDREPGQAHSLDVMGGRRSGR